MNEVVELTRELVALNTVNPDLEPGAPGERPAVEHLAARLERSGFEIEIVGPADRPSLLATHRGRTADARAGPQRPPGHRPGGRDARAVHATHRRRPPVRPRDM